MDCQITSGYGIRTLYGVRNAHYALDFRGAVGAPVYAALQGTVIRVNALNWAGKPDGYQSKELPHGYGADVEIDHGNGFWTRYSHLSKCLVKIGQCVDAGELIGHVGNAGTGPHLHFELKTKPGYISYYLKKGINIGIDPSPYLTTDLNLVV